MSVSFDALKTETFFLPLTVGNDRCDNVMYSQC